MSAPTVEPDAWTLRSGFLESARLHPGADALRIKDRAWTYAEASDTARRWAASLIEASGRRPLRVGVFGHRSEVSYLGALASLMAGAAFVPLNPQFPASRTRTMLAQADVDALLVDGKALPQLADVLHGIDRPPPVLLPETDASATQLPVAFDRAAMSRVRALRTLPPVAPPDLAYLLFTSGSTGRPKGVPITHANVRAFLDVNRRRYALTPDDRLTQTFDQTFDLSIFDLFMAWESGACVCSPQPIDLLSPFQFIERHGVTVWFSVPSVAALLQKQKLLTPGSLPTLRFSLFCGEGLRRSTAEAWQAAAPGSIVENLYGPTELTIACSAYRWNAGRSSAECVQDLVPIGRFYEGLSEIVVDERLDPVAPGASGELCVAGPQTFPGYWRAPEQTEERVFHRPQEGGAPLRYYRTGDLVRRLASGEYVHLGRIDHQVKIGGYRIELGEVEAELRRAGCAEAAVMPWPSREAAEHLVAYVSGAAHDVTALQKTLRGSLPGYMVPRAIHVVDRMPLNVNGKVDRERLRAGLDEESEEGRAP